MAFQLFQVPGPTPRMSQTVRIGQQVQPFAGFHRLGKVAHGARVAHIAFLRHVGHQKVIAHQPFDSFGFLLRQAQTRADAAGHLGADDGVILGSALADVVQQQGECR